MNKLQIKQEPNPVGTIYIVSSIERRIEELKVEWNSLVTRAKENFSWRFWTWGQKIDHSVAVDFLMKSLDDFIRHVDNVLDNGPDKKATVMYAVEKLYDYIVREALPIWMKPFTKQIKKYMLNKVVSPAIDWVVDKYRNGQWRDNLQGSNNEEQQEN